MTENERDLLMLVADLLIRQLPPATRDELMKKYDAVKVERDAVERSNHMAGPSIEENPPEVK